MQRAASKETSPVDASHDSTLEYSSDEKQKSTLSALREFYAQHGVDLDSLMLHQTCQSDGVKNKNTNDDTTGDDDDDDDNNESTIFKHRFIRLNPRFDAAETLCMLRNEVQNSRKTKAATPESSIAYPIAIPWLDKSFGYYALPATFALSQSPCFRHARIYGQDVSSGAAIAALLTDWYDVCNNKNTTVLATEQTAIRQPLRVLDMCCAPGAKLCAIADWLEHNTMYNDYNGNVSDVGKFTSHDKEQDDGRASLSPSLSMPAVITGVDVSSSRLDLTKKLIRKYRIDTLSRDDNSITYTDSSNNSKDGLSNNCCNADRDDRGNANDSNSICTHKSGARIRLYEADGTTFGHSSSISKTGTSSPQHTLVFDSQATIDEMHQQKQPRGKDKKRKRMNKSARSRERKSLSALSTWDWLEDDIRPLSALPSTESGANILHSTELISSALKYAQSNSSNGNGNSNISIQLFDRVLVDAECSTDGSLRHVKKALLQLYSAQGSSIILKESKNDNISKHTLASLTNPDAMHALVTLQKKLLSQGYALLRPGGYLVYATCSLSEQQNDNVVASLLVDHDDAEIVPLHFDTSSTKSKSRKLPGTVQFIPNIDAGKKVVTPRNQENDDGTKVNGDKDELVGGGFYVAKIYKSQ